MVDEHRVLRAFAEYYSVIKRNELSSQTDEPKNVYVSKVNEANLKTRKMIPTLRHSEKGKVKETEKELSGCYRVKWFPQ